MDSAVRHMPATLDQIGVEQVTTKRHKRKKVVSLFSGCGGMDLGFLGGFQFGGQTYGRHPFEITWANDLNAAACKTYEHNFGHSIHCGDIWDNLDTLPKRADIVIGGFPCQDVSINGKLKADKGERSTLYKAMQEVVARTKPEIFVAENVKGILMEHSQVLYNSLVSGFENIGYRVNTKLYLAADFGVPQMRERVFIVGTKNRKPTFEHPEAIFNKDEWVTASQCLADLELKKHDQDTSHIWSKAKLSPEQGQRRLTAGKPGTTIRAECHGNSQFHYKLARRISMREAARIQSFPDEFKFCSGLRETERQVGNAVPPVLAWHLASAVQEYLS